MKIRIERFKKILNAEIELGPVSVFIGTNNSGKSSFIQGVQFAISSGQTLELRKARWVKGKSRTSSLDSTEYLYTPTRYIENLYHGQRLTGSRLKGERKHIGFTFTNVEGIEAKLSISKGKNGGFTTTLRGKELGEVISRVDIPYCVYVPGIAGIPVEEKFEVPIAIKKSATRGDSNNYLRNILLEISKDEIKWNRFLQSISGIYDDTSVIVKFDQNESEFIWVEVTNGGISLPLDSIGTGLLQAIQVFAYIEYFNPSLVLLDEPDAHIHPTKQKLLASQLFERTLEDNNLKIVFSTHSRYILEALEDKAKVFHFQNGHILPDIKGSKILIDIGAADADYLFAKKDLKYIIVTEDRVDDIKQKKEFIKKFAIANGLKEYEFVLHSYEGSTKVDFAKILRGFVEKQIPGIKIIVHFDKDQRPDDDQDLLKLKDDCQKRDLKLFITNFSEIENYFCQPEHLSEIYGISLEDSQNIYEINVRFLEEETKRKTSNFILRERPYLSHNNDNQPDIAIVNAKTNEWYELYSDRLTPGKELLGKMKNNIQNELQQDPNLILDISSKLISPTFSDLLEDQANL